jgi:hypothetical protein
MPNVCQALEAVAKSCDNNSGGLHGIALIPQDDVVSVTVNTTNPGDYEVTAFTLTTIPAPILFTDYYIRRNTSNYTEELASDLVNGSSFVTQTINLIFHRREMATSRAIKILGSGQQYLSGIVKDANGKYWYFPYLQLSASGEGSGTARADGSKYSLTLIAQNEFLAYEVVMSSAALQAIGVSF